MLVHEKSRHLILNVRDRQRVLGVIPHARPIQLRGHDLLAVPHRLDEVRLLRNLGMKAPAPAAHYYKYPGIYSPFAHQRATVEFLTTNPRAFCTSGLGSGKSLCGLWGYDYLRSIGQVRKLLVVAPLSTLQRAWGDEVLTHFHHLEYAVLHGPLERRMAALARPDVDVYIINPDGLKNAQVREALAKRDTIDMVIVDEVASYRNKSTERWKNLNLIINGRKQRGVPDPEYPVRTWAWGFTGTPTPNEPTDAWAQIKLINPSKAASHFGAFRDQTMRQLTQFKWAPKPDAMETVHKAMQPCIRFAREDCIDLPPTTYIALDTELSPEQDRAYDAMMKRMQAETDEGAITAVNAAVKLGRLLQIGAGGSYAKDGQAIHLPCGPRIEVMREVIAQAEAKVLVFVPYTAALDMVADALAKDYAVAKVDGRTSATERNRIYADFQRESTPHVLVANPGTLSHGLTLTAADTIVWFAPVYSNEIWEQANGRIARPGQTRNTRIVTIAGSPADRKVYATLRNKGEMQGVLLDLLKTGKPLTR